MARSREWSGIPALAALATAIAALALALVGAFGSGMGWWHFRQGFSALGIALFLAIAALAMALFIFGFRKRYKPRALRFAAAGAVLALLYLGTMGYFISRATSVPAIHDITTDLADPPQFAVLPARTDSLANVPGMDRPDLAKLDAVERWRALHREAYGDLATLAVPLTVAEATKLAAELARERGWSIAVSDPAAGRVEATDTVSLFRFRDDVVIRVRPAQGGGARLDLRSVSRVGLSDLGVNAARITDFLDDYRAMVAERS